MENVDHTTLSSSGSPERPAKVWNNHLLQSSMKVLTPSWFLPHRHHWLSLTAATWLNLIGSQDCIKSWWLVLVLLWSDVWPYLVLCWCLTDIAPTNLQLLKTTRPLQSLSILMTSVSLWTSNETLCTLWTAYGPLESSVSSPVHCSEV